MGDQHNVDAADSIVATIPVALTAYEDAAAALQVAAAVAVTRESPQSQQFAALFADPLRSIVRGASVRAATAKAGQAAGVDVSNANRGGENVATGAMIGALLGAACGYDKLPAHLVSGLSKGQHEQLLREIDQFVETVPFAKL